MEPERAYLPPRLERGGRIWGFGVNLYTLRSARNWGIGDFTDLRTIIEQASQLGADLVGVNPLHALDWSDPEAASPYRPSSRFFLNPLYIDIEAVPEYADDSETRRLVASRAFRTQLDEARASPIVRYGLVADCKRRVLELLYEAFRRNDVDRRRAFGRFKLRDPVRLRRFATYQALVERLARDARARDPDVARDSWQGRPPDWLRWPEELRDPDSPALERFAAEAHRRIGFYEYLQFVADEQLAGVAAAAREMEVGLYRDLAVGVGLDSADVWSEQSRYDFNHTIGAPPDAFGPLGQNWGLVPLDPAALERDDGSYYGMLLASNMRYAGALRIDHAMSLQRLFWIPRAAETRDGGYVPYPFDALLGQCATASIRAHCLIVGEDLGTVPDGFRERMERASILGYRLLLFEHDGDGRFIPPERYPQNVLATATTHDLPTLIGWVLSRDIDVRVGAALLDRRQGIQGSALRRLGATRFLEALQSAGELDSAMVERLHKAIDSDSSTGSRVVDSSLYGPLVEAAYRFLARTPARIVLVQLDDVAGELDQINMPGTYDEYPNWRRKGRLAVEDLASDERIVSFASQLNGLIRGGQD